MLLLIRARTPGRDRASLIDAAIIATGLGLLSWVFLMKPAATDWRWTGPAAPGPRWPWPCWILTTSKGSTTQLVARADQALYQAKQAGRNQVLAARATPGTSRVHQDPAHMARLADALRPGS